jgi:hypothetical protein
MSKVYSFFCLILLISFSSCKKDKKSETFSIEISLVMKYSDSIHIYYSKTESIEFNETMSFWKKIQGSKKNQILTINFPDTIQPNQLRLDFGRNYKQQEIILNEITLLYKQKVFSAKGKEIYNLFRVDNSNTRIDKLTGSLIRKDQNQVNGPSIYPNGNNLHKQLQLLFSQNASK